MHKRDKTLLMFPDRRHRISGWVSLVKILFNITRVFAILAAVVLLAAMIVYPVFRTLAVIFTLGLVKKSSIPSIDPFLEVARPLTIGLVAGALGLFVLKWALEWIVILNQSRINKKNPQENHHQIQIARAVRRSKFIDLMVFLLLAGTIIACAAVMMNLNDEFGQKTFPIICASTFVGVFIFGKILSSWQFKKVQPNIDAVLKSMYTPQPIHIQCQCCDNRQQSVTPPVPIPQPPPPPLPPVPQEQPPPPTPPTDDNPPVTN